MERLRTLAVLVILGAETQATQIASADDQVAPAPVPIPAQATPGPADSAAPPKEQAPAPLAASAADRPEPPAAPRKYLETAAKLFNKRRYDLAVKYLEAANMYRDRLSPNEQVVLEVYQEKYREYLREQETASDAPAAAKVIVSPGSDPGIVTASVDAPRALDMSGKAPVSQTDPLASAIQAALPGSGSPAASAPPSSMTPTSANTTVNVRAENLGVGAGTKDKARWLLHQAREKIFRHDLDGAAQIAAEVRGMDVKWGYFDDTPDKVVKTIEIEREKHPKESTPAAVASNSNSGTNPNARPAANTTRGARDRRAARSVLREARAALASGQIDKAETLARDVKAWGLHFGLLDDTPEKVAASAVEARRLEAIRNAELMVRSYVGTDAGKPGDSRGEPTLPVAADAVPSPPR